MIIIIEISGAPLSVVLYHLTKLRPHSFVGRELPCICARARLV